jgi:hypothetical protein
MGITLYFDLGIMVLKMFMLKFSYAADTSTLGFCCVLQKVISVNVDRIL